MSCKNCKDTLVCYPLWRGKNNPKVHAGLTLCSISDSIMRFLPRFLKRVTTKTYREENTACYLGDFLWERVLLFSSIIALADVKTDPA